MRKLSFILFIVLLISSCKPSLYEIHQLETSLEIKEGALLVQLKDERENIELFEQYNRPKKAARLEKETEQYNVRIKTAFKQHYSYSDYIFILQKEWIDSLQGKMRVINDAGQTVELENANIFYASFNTKKEIEDEREFDATTIFINDLAQDVNSFIRKIEVTTHNVGEYPNFDYLARQTNKKLKEWEKKRLENKIKTE